jgi:hypothetical protein
MMGENRVIYPADEAKRTGALVADELGAPSV